MFQENNNSSNTSTQIGPLHHLIDICTMSLLEGLQMGGHAEHLVPVNMTVQVTCMVRMHIADILSYRKLCK